jgi:hypothetical protein
MVSAGDAEAVVKLCAASYSFFHATSSFGASLAMDSSFAKSVDVACFPMSGSVIEIWLLMQMETCFDFFFELESIRLYIESREALAV